MEREANVRERIFREKTLRLRAIERFRRQEEERRIMELARGSKLRAKEIEVTLKENPDLGTW